MSEPSVIADYIRLLTGDPRSVVCWQLFPDADKSRQGLIATFHATLDQAMPTLAGFNRLGAGVFINITNTDGYGRKRENVTGSNVVCIDSDGTLQLSDFKPVIPATFIVKRNESHWHAYWKTHTLSVDEFIKSQKTLAAYYGTDSTVCKPTQVMRVPGFYHMKNPDNPQMVTLHVNVQ